MKVFLLAGVHPIYEDLIEFPPRNVEYITNLKKETFDRLEIYTSRSYKRKKAFITKLMSFFNLPRIYYTFRRCDLIHSSRGFLILNKKPWVVDIEHAASFVGMKHSRIKEKRYKKTIEKFLSSKYCKKILPHCIAAEKSMYATYDISGFKNKIEVVYPAKQIITKKLKGHKNIRILFVGRNFVEKGGRELLRAFEILTQKYDNIEIVMKSDVPEVFRKKYSKSNIVFSSEILPKKELFERYYLRSDIFVMPTYMDTFGIVFLDAMSAGLPLVGTDIFAVPEIIENGKNGFLIHSPIRWHDENYLCNPQGGSKKDRILIVKQLVEKLSLLIEDSSLRRRMGRYGKRLVEKGKFSIKERNKKLERIYQEALGY